ncbi:MAG: UDP-N-acetylmuramoyl-tripeptide--D-alanyl-D-alanine ligase [Gammaproteobacteria bacterium]|nr:UDP-N-acetylmuramoyl-tripeptide--D-alanyl-D-alanine ligase [Gammaproteobacteria bacterium]NNJ90352.1 UDP-N-acetylmuramoyl-tripeptide--D-alanyl-D-alanine ligase [Gammaproteobacteria bacterium]
MTSMSLSSVAKKINASVVGDDAVFSSVSTDTRRIRSGDLFVALKGENFDGHDYVGQAFQQGAVAAMVSHPVSDKASQLLVDDTRRGLGDMASEWRKQVNPRVVALTGSNGKTTLKEMLAAILSEENHVLATLGNLNNDIGVPLTLLRLQDEEIAIVEMGANHVGEIDYLSRMARPDVAILNNAGRAHIGEFGSEEAIAHAKAEILNGLNDEGVFIYNADSKWVPLWKKLAGEVNSLSFGTSAQADYQLLDDYRLNWNESGFYAVFTIEENQTGHQQLIRLPLAGEHNAMNTTAAFAAARILGVASAIISQRLENLEPVKGRLKPVAGVQGQMILDDAYNANADSVSAAMDVVVTAPGRKILVLGDLAELGDDAEKIHAELGSLAFEKGIDVLLSCGDISRFSSDSFKKQAQHFETRESLTAWLQVHTGKGDFVLIKGSRSALMDQVVDALAVNATVDITGDDKGGVSVC